MTRVLLKATNLGRRRNKLAYKKLRIGHLHVPYLLVPIVVFGALVLAHGLYLERWVRPSLSLLFRYERPQHVPYFLWGKTRFASYSKFDSYQTYKRIHSENAAAIVPSNNNNNDAPTSWILSDPLLSNLRNHDSILLESSNNNDNKYYLVNILGRFSRTVQLLNLQTGQQFQRHTLGQDPDGNALDNLNHVYSVVVDSLDGRTREVWLPCGFYGDAVNTEYSISYARIVDLSDLSVRAGPKLPHAGGACVALPIAIDGPGTPPHICTFGGTDGSHDRGRFEPHTACYDRVQQRWHSVFGTLPYGLDHGNLVQVPAGTCHPQDPSRLLIFNYRTRSYGEQRPEILAFDLPQGGWTREQIMEKSRYTASEWYVYANFSYAPYSPFELDDPADAVNRARDASGVLLADGGRHVLNFGGIHYRYPSEQEIAAARPQVLKHKMIKTFQMIRMLDVCEKKWKKVGDLGVQVFAIMTAASRELNLAVTCGGNANHQPNNNNPYCIVSRIPGFQLENPKGDLSSMAPDFVARLEQLMMAQDATIGS